MATREAVSVPSRKLRSASRAKFGVNQTLPVSSAKNKKGLEKPPLIFLSYVREDGFWMRRLLVVLKHLERRGLIRIFHYQHSLTPGDEWLSTVEEALQEASVAICFLSPQYFASDFVMGYEVPLIQRLHDQGLLNVVPVLLKDSLWEIDPFWAGLQMFTDEEGNPLINGNGAVDVDRVQEYFVRLARHVFRLLPEPPEPLPPSAGLSSNKNPKEKHSAKRLSGFGRSKGPRGLDESYLLQLGLPSWTLALRQLPSESLPNQIEATSVELTEASVEKNFFADTALLALALNECYQPSRDLTATPSADFADPAAAEPCLDLVNHNDSFEWQADPTGGAGRIPLPSKSKDHKLSLPIDEETAHCWLHGEGDQLAVQTEVFKSCLRWLCLRPRGLSVLVLEEIVWTAMAEAFSDFYTLELSARGALNSLQRSLNRLRAREDRRHRLEVPWEEFSEEPADSGNYHGELFDRDLWMQVVWLIEPHLTKAMLSLSSRDREVLAYTYGLEEVNDPVRPSAHPMFSSMDAEKKALTRAHKRFSRHLESLLVADLALSWYLWAIARSLRRLGRTI